MNEIARICTEARDLIRSDGFHAGLGGWTGIGGWCIEGAIGRVLGLTDQFTSHRPLSEAINAHPVAGRIKQHLGMRLDTPLYVWNDRQAESAPYVGVDPAKAVLQVLAEVAAKYADQPEMIEVPVFRIPEPKCSDFKPMITWGVWEKAEAKTLVSV